MSDPHGYEPLDPGELAQWEHAHAAALEYLRKMPVGAPFLCVMADKTAAGIAGIGEGDHVWFHRAAAYATALAKEREATGRIGDEETD